MCRCAAVALCTCTMAQLYFSAIVVLDRCTAPMRYCIGVILIVAPTSVSCACESGTILISKETSSTAAAHSRCWKQVARVLIFFKNRNGAEVADEAASMPLPLQSSVTGILNGELAPSFLRNCRMFVYAFCYAMVGHTA